MWDSGREDPFVEARCGGRHGGMALGHPIVLLDPGKIGSDQLPPPLSRRAAEVGVPLARRSS